MSAPIVCLAAFTELIVSGEMGELTTKSILFCRTFFNPICPSKNLSRSDPSTYKGTPCSISRDKGWNTDLSCRGNPSDLYPCPCEKCLGDLRNPYGVLFDSGGSCGSSGQDPFLGSLWMHNSFDCIGGGSLGSLKSCTFPEDTHVRIWTDGKTQGGTCGWWGAQCLSPSNNCPRIVVCPTP